MSFIMPTHLSASAGGLKEPLENVSLPPAVVIKTKNPCHENCGYVAFASPVYGLCLGACYLRGDRQLEEYTMDGDYSGPVVLVSEKSSSCTDKCWYNAVISPPAYGICMGACYLASYRLEESLKGIYQVTDIDSRELPPKFSPKVSGKKSVNNKDHV